VKRIVLMSSIRAQCGPVSSGCVSETDTPAPTDAYGRSKLAGERALAAALAGSSTEHVILRPVVIYGAHAKGNMATLARLARSPIPVPFANLTAQRSVLAIPNLLDAVAHALSAPGLAGQTCIVADPEALTLPEMIAALRAGLGRRAGVLPLAVGLIGRAAALVGRGETLNRLTGGLAVDVSRLRSSGWRPQFGSEVGLYRWMRGE
jgi:UDP-glucose 4-epimerase